MQVAFPEGSFANRARCLGKHLFRGNVLDKADCASEGSVGACQPQGEPTKVAPQFLTHVPTWLRLRLPTFDSWRGQSDRLGSH